MISFEISFLKNKIFSSSECIGPDFFLHLLYTEKAGEIGEI